MSTSTTPTKAKLAAARRSLTVWASAAVPAVLAAAEALKDQLPSLSGLLVGWRLVAVSVAVSTVIAVLRVRGVKGDSDA